MKSLPLFNEVSSSFQWSLFPFSMKSLPLSNEVSSPFQWSLFPFPMLTWPPFCLAFTSKSRPRQCRTILTKKYYISSVLNHQIEYMAHDSKAKSIQKDLLAFRKAHCYIKYPDKSCKLSVNYVFVQTLVEGWCAIQLSDIVWVITELTVLLLWYLRRF